MKHQLIGGSAQLSVVLFECEFKIIFGDKEMFLC